jgi:hypothetical protein
MPVVPKPGVMGRKRLRQFLENKLISIENNETSPEIEALRMLLREAVEGLVALSYGETQPIFERIKTKDKGSKPYTAKKLRMTALGFVDLLRAKGYTASKAYFAVARAYKVSEDAIKSWQKQKNLGKTSDPWLQSIRDKIGKNKDAWDEDRVWLELERARFVYKLAKKKK